MLNLLIDADSKRAVDSLFGDSLARIPEFSASEARAISVCPIKRIRSPWDSRVFTPKDPADWTIQVALGAGFVLPLAGTWPISYGASSSTAIISNAPTQDEISNVLNGLDAIVSAGGVTVQGADGFFTFTFDAVGARTMISGDVSLLVPLSLLTFEEIVVGDADTQEVQILRIAQNAGAFATLSTATSAAAVAFSLIQAGSGSANAKWRVTLSIDRWGGYWTFTKPSGATSEPIGYDDNEAQIQSVFEGIYGTGNVVVLQETDDTFTVEHIGANTHTAMTIVSTTDATALKTILFKSGLLDLRTTGIEMLLNGADESIVRFEVEAADATGYPEKVLQRDVMLRRPVLTADMTQPSVSGDISGSNTDVAISTAGTTTITGQPGFIQWFQLITAAAGSGGYERSVVLDRATNVPKRGAIMRIEVDFSASDNPTINFYDGTVLGTLIDTVQGDAAAASYYVLEARFTGSVWKKLSGRFAT